MIGAGARLRTIHQRLADARPRAHASIPSNLGGTLAGWFVTGGIGMNAFGARPRARHGARGGRAAAGGRARALPRRRPARRARRRRRAAARSAAAERDEWFRARGYAAADARRPRRQRGRARRWCCSSRSRSSRGRRSARSCSRSSTATRRSRRRSGSSARPATRFPRRPTSSCSRARTSTTRGACGRTRTRASGASEPGELSSSDATCRGRASSAPRSWAPACGADRAHAGAYLFVDFLDLEAARAFAAALAACPGAPRVLDAESVRFAAERFRPQQTKRLGPGLLAAEILMPARRGARASCRAPSALATRVGRAARRRGLLPRRRRGAGDRRLPHRPPQRRLRGRPHARAGAARPGDARATAAGPTCSAAGSRRSPRASSGATAPSGCARVKQCARSRRASLNRGVLLGLRLRGVARRARCRRRSRPASASLALRRRARSRAARALGARGARGVLAALRTARRADAASRRAVGATFRDEPGRPARRTPRRRGTRRRGPAAATTRAPLRQLRRVQLACARSSTSPRSACRRCSRTSARRCARGDGARRHRQRAARPLHALRQLRGGLPGRHPAPAALRGDAAALGRRRARATASGTPRSLARAARLAALHARVPRRAPGRLPASARRPRCRAWRASCVLRAENDAGPAATCIHCGACVRGVPDPRQPRVRGRRSALDHHRAGPLHRLRHLRRGVPGEST